jgi:hypothetical protein
MFLRLMDILWFLRNKENTAEDYYVLLPRIHSFLKPAAYAEIGIRHGASLRMATTAESVELTRRRKLKARCRRPFAFSK